MNRPPEYDNAIAKGWLEPIQPTSGAIPQYLQNASNYLAAAQALPPKLSLQAFTMAYEGYFQLVQAVLELYEVRTKDAGRNFAIARVSSDLKLRPVESSLVGRAHARRNATSYQSPFPPVSQQEASALIGILQQSIPQAYKLTGAEQPGAPAAPSPTMP